MTNPLDRPVTEEEVWRFILIDETEHYKACLDDTPIPILIGVRAALTDFLARRKAAHD